ncbi:MAG TPA: hypothetical protein VFF91_07095 [Pseudoxanthomonas sp.]|nr:hypothetical protein [Pseudoxanthomonas sp.]
MSPDEHERTQASTGQAGTSHPEEDANPGNPLPPDPRAGIASEVGDLEDPNEETDGSALPGRAGGGLAGG